MLRKLILVDEETTAEFMFPVTPPAYQVADEMLTQTVDIVGVGEYTAPTYARQLPIQIENVLLPAQQYPYCVAYQPQRACLDWLTTRMIGKKRLRFIVSGTQINRLVQITAINGGEKDGSNDWKGSITLQPCVVLEAPQVQIDEPKVPTARSPATGQTQITTYTVKAGDTLWGIAQKFYGDGSLCYKLAAYNGIKNANIIKVGQVLKIPPAATLGKTTPVKPTATSPSTKPKTPPKQTTQTLTVTATGPEAYWGWHSWNYVDAATGVSKNGKWRTYPYKITASAGTAVNISWQSRNGHKVGRALLDGKRLTNSGASSIRVVLNVGHSLDVAWEK